MRLSMLFAVMLLFASVYLVNAEDTKDEPTKGVTTVTMVNDEFQPKKVEIKVGESIVWENKGSKKHTATSDDGKTFDTKDVAPGKRSDPVKFTKEGEVPYYCIHHGKPGGGGMSGTIVVKAAPKKDK